MEWVPVKKDSEDGTDDIDTNIGAPSNSFNFCIQMQENLGSLTKKCNFWNITQDD